MSLPLSPTTLNLTQPSYTTTTTTSPQTITTPIEIASTSSTLKSAAAIETSSCFSLIAFPIESPTLSERENKVRTGDIERRLTNALQQAANQMAQERSKDFHYLEAPASFNDHAEKKTIGDYEVGICLAQGRRPSMEDEHLASTFNVNIQGKVYPIHLFGVFDGHGGDKVSEFVKKYLQNELAVALINFNPDGLTDEGIWNALKIACVSLDKKIPREFSRQGSTATFAMILDGKLWTVNVGDSRTVLDDGGIPVQLSEDAKPTNPRYTKGIKARQGFIYNSRLYGSLAIARAFGDHYCEGAASARPKITVLPLKDIGPESHLVLACDGIYDVASTAQVVKAVHEHREESLSNLAKNLVYSAYAARSTDNLTALVVKLS